MKLIEKVLNFCCAILILTLLIAAIRNITSPESWLPTLILAPIFAYAVIGLGEKLPRNGSFFLGGTPQTIKKIFGALGAISSLVLLIAGALAITSLRDLAFASIFLPLLVKFALLSQRNLMAVIRQWQEKKRAKALARELKTKETVQDEARRRFIKILAGAGVGAVLVGLMNPKKIGAAFFGSVPGPGTVAMKDSGGAKIDPAIKSPTDSYGIANVDEATYPHYYGFIHYNGTDWYILNEASNGIYTYASKLNNLTLAYTDAWTARTTATVFGSYSAAF